jgi:hypothetical protein
VADPGTMTTTAPDRELVAGDGRAVRRTRTLPGGRAVVGGLLVAASAVGVFAAFLHATSEPSTSYLVARSTVEPGTRLDSIATLAELFEARAIDLDGDLARRAIRLDDADSLLGRLVLPPLEPGELLPRSALVADGGVAYAHKLSFAIDRSAALAGDLEVGERLDVLATYGSGADAYTAYVVRGVPLVARSGEVIGSGALGGGGGPLTLTVAVTSPEDVQALAHAVATAEIVVVRSTVAEGDRSRAPGPYSASPDRSGPVPDPAGDPVGVADAPRVADEPDGAEPSPATGGGGRPADRDQGAGEDAGGEG